MLNTISSSPLSATSIKSHGSESRTAPGYNPVEAQAVQSVPTQLQGIGLDAGSILSSVNAEAATAGNRTILQTLALAVAIRLNIARRSDETLEALFQRIAAALDDLPAKTRAELEAKTGLKALNIRIADLANALRQPDSTLAARLSAMAEAPLATPQRTAAAAATVSYMQQDSGGARAAETLAMVNQARNNSEGMGLFSSAALPDAAGEAVPGDARTLQNQLKSLFEPGIAETRIEIASHVEEPMTIVLGEGETFAETEAVTTQELVTDPAETTPSLPSETAEAQEPAVSEHATPGRQTGIAGQLQREAQQTLPRADAHPLLGNEEDPSIEPATRNLGSGNQRHDDIAERRPGQADTADRQVGREDLPRSFSRTEAVALTREDASQGATALQQGERNNSQRPQNRLPDAQPADSGLDDVEEAGNPAERAFTASADGDRDEPANSKIRMQPEENRMRTAPPASNNGLSGRDTDARTTRTDGAVLRDRPESSKSDAALRLTDAGQSGRAGSLKASPQLNRTLADQPLPMSNSADDDRHADVKPLSRPVEQQRQATPPAAHNSNRQTAESQLRAIARDIVAERLAADLRVTASSGEDDHRVQTLLALKGLSEVQPVTTEWDVPQPEREPVNARPLQRAPEQSRLAGDDLADGARDIVAQPGPRFGRDSIPGAFEPAPIRRSDAENEAKAGHRTETGAAVPAGQAEQEQMLSAKAAPPRVDAMGFAYAAQQPVREGFRAEAPDERQARDEEGQERGDEEAREDPEQRRERLARKATDDLLRAEPEAEPALRITRDSSESDRAYALYQRMGGF